MTAAASPSSSSAPLARPPTQHLPHLSFSSSIAKRIAKDLASSSADTSCSEDAAAAAAAAAEAAPRTSAAVAAALAMTSIKYLLFARGQVSVLVEALEKEREFEATFGLAGQGPQGRGAQVGKDAQKRRKRDQVSARRVYAPVTAEGGEC